MKVITTAAALELLGANFRFETHLQIDGFIDHEGVLQGNLYIKGFGDPCLGSKRFGGYKKQIEIWVEAIRGFGIRKIAGKIIGDASHWEKAQAVASWQWEDLGNYYGAGASALSFHDNEYTLFFEQAPTFQKAKISHTDPEICHRLTSEVIVGPNGSVSTIFGCEFSDVHHVRGQIADDFNIRGSFPDASVQVAFLLTKALVVEGKEIKVGERKVIHKTISPSIEEIVYWTNQQSVNLYAEHLLKQMGEGSTENGIKAVRSFLSTLGISLDGFQMADGSGLSRKNLVTARQMVELLEKMKGNRAFERSLPDEVGGTKAKSGSMSAIKGFVGYKGNKVFALIVNNFLNFDQKMTEIKQFLTQL